MFVVVVVLDIGIGDCDDSGGGGNWGIGGGFLTAVPLPFTNGQKLFLEENEVKI